MPAEVENTRGLFNPRFNLTNSLFIRSALRAFMLAVRVGSVQRSIRVKYSDIEKKRLELTTPKTGSLYIQASTVYEQMRVSMLRMLGNKVRKNIFKNSMANSMDSLTMQSVL